MRPLDAALALIKQGYAPVPIPTRKKKPLIEEWPDLRITAETAPQYFNGEPQNIGVILGAASKGGAVDVDLDAPEAVALADRFLPLTDVQFGRAGKPRSHRLYHVPGLETKKFRAPDVGMIVEVRSTGCQTVFPPSIHESGQPITWHSEGEPTPVSGDALLRAAGNLAAAALLVRHFPATGSRDEFAMVLAGVLLRAGMPVEEAEHFIEAVATEAGSEDVSAKVAKVAATRAKLDAGAEVTGLPTLKELIGDKVAELVNKWLRVPAAGAEYLSTPIHEVVEKLNERHALVIVGDKTAILQKGLDAEGHPEVRLLTLGAFKEWYRPHRVQVGKRTMTHAEVWLEDPQRQQYEGLVFAPGRPVEHHYNLWRGLAIQPNPEGDCSLFLEHLRENVCQGRDELYQYLLGWLAQLIQQPATKIGTSIVLRGPQGVGKTIVGKTMGVLLGDHYALVSDPRYITGRFNSHLTDKILLHADEGFWAGDRAAEGKLKDLITGDYQWIEFKGKEAIRVRNYLRLLVTGNADWIVPAGLEERRFAVLDVGEAHMQDHAYFGAMEAQLQAGGYGALLHHLQTFDLNQVNLRKIPETGALFEQKIASLSAEEGWWLDILTNGKLPGDTGGNGFAPAPLLYDSYIRHSQRIGIKRRSIETQVGRFLKKHVPKYEKHEGQYADPATAETRRCTVYHFPSLEKCRATFATATRHPGDWEGPTEWARGDLEPTI